jgi:hypothetical protein
MDIVFCYSFWNNFIMTPEQIKKRLEPLVIAIQQAEQNHADEKASIKAAIAGPYINKPCKITKGDYEGSEGRIVNVLIDPNCDVWFLVQLGTNAYYYQIEFLEVFLEK